jgi:hypothetical protein
VWFLLLITLFTPSAALHHLALDGAWQFGGVVERQADSDLETEVLEELNETVELNSVDSPDYLVNNRFDWPFVGKGSAWLEFKYQAWSKETERGFDEPALVIFLGEELIFKKGIEEICCEERTERVYLGELTGDQRLSFFAGEMGDLAKPTILRITEVKVLKAKAVVPAQARISPTPTIELKRGVAVNTPLSSNFDPDQYSFTPHESSEGEVLGASTKQRLVEEPIGWHQVLQHFFNHPLTPVMLGLSLLLLLVLLYLTVSLLSVLITTVKKRLNK